MDILCTDLDNTIIYSYKHDIGYEKRKVEIYQDREISFITDETFKLLKEVKEKYLIIPLSTRTVEQYKRIDLGLGEFSYALTCNGGILLVNGERDYNWYAESVKLASNGISELQKALEYLKNDERRKFELRFIEELFVFTKSNNPLSVVYELREYLDSSLVDIFSNGEKIYVVPKGISKGKAVERLRKYLQIDSITAAGDSEFDVSMLKKADKGLAPYGFKKKFKISDNIFEMPKERIFSEALLEECLKNKINGR